MPWVRDHRTAGDGHAAAGSAGGSEIDMLSGPLAGKIVRFALPLALSSILQQLFNAADTAVVGRFAGSGAMAAVGSSGAVINLAVSLFIGISVGANVVISSLIGSGRRERISAAVHTVITAAFFTGILLLFAGLFSARFLLTLLGTPENVLGDAVLYLRIYFLGTPFLLLYNYGAAVLRSMGDSDRPFYALTAAGILNVLLNLLLVIVFHLDVAGVAIATSVSNGASAYLVLRMLSREKEPFRFRIRDARITREPLVRMLQIGVPAGLQGTLFSLSNAVIQTGINSFGSDAVAGSAAALTFEYICAFLIGAFAQTCMTFTSQNFAAGKYGRCRSVFRISLAGGALSCGACNALCWVFRGALIGIFTEDPAVAAFARERMDCVLLVQWIAASYEVAGGAMRGMGHSFLPTVLCLIGTCLFRLVWTAAVFPRFGTFSSLLYVYFATWVLTGVLVLTAYFRLRKRLFGGA